MKAFTKKKTTQKESKKLIEQQQKNKNWVRKFCFQSL